MKTLRMAWFSEILAGRKRVDGRLGAPLLAPGEVFYIQDRDGKIDHRRAVVVALRHYPTLHAYISAEWQRTCPQAVTLRDSLAMHNEIVSKGEQVFDFRRVEERGGVTALEFKVTPDVGATTLRKENPRAAAIVQEYLDLKNGTLITETDENSIAQCALILNSDVGIFIEDMLYAHEIISEPQRRLVREALILS